MLSITKVPSPSNSLFPAGVEETPTGLIFHSEISKVEWDKMGYTLAGIVKGVNWWIGDWLAYGERFGLMSEEEKALSQKRLDRAEYGQLIAIGKVMRVSPKTLSNVKRAAQRISFPRRRPNVTVYDTIEILNQVPDDAQYDVWAARIEAEDLSQKDVRAELRRTYRTEKPSPTHTRPPLFSSAVTQFMVKWRHMKPTLSKATLRYVKNEMKDFLDVMEEIE